MRLTKASATGNDFILIDLLDGPPFTGDRSEMARRVCDRHEGVGADGAVFLESAGDTAIQWDFFNADGGRAEMCGNATRAVGLYVHHRTSRAEVNLRTVVGMVRVRVHSPARIESTLPALGEMRSAPHYVFVRAGVPHAVLAVSNVKNWPDLRARAHEIKGLPEFRAAGVNVTFYETRGANQIEAVTFERGVEDFTLSCGTGAVAAAFAAHLGRTVGVRVPGGDLHVVCDKDQPVLIGPARLIAHLDWLDLKELR